MPYSGQTIKPIVKLGASPEDCWEWLGTISTKTGYGKKTVNGESVLAHRWMYTNLFGPIPRDKVVNHICSNRACVNPQHLEIVTQAENCRHGKGARLKAEQVRIIKSLKSRSKRGDRKLIAERFGVSPQLISDIWYGRAWIDQ